MFGNKDFYVELFRTWHKADKQYGIDQEQDMHPGLALGLVVLMEDDLVHTDEHPYCDDESCPCHDEPEPMDDDYINLSARSVAETEPGEPDGSGWYLSRPNQSDWLVD